MIVVGIGTADPTQGKGTGRGEDHTEVACLGSRLDGEPGLAGEEGA